MVPLVLISKKIFKKDRSVVRHFLPDFKCTIIFLYISCNMQSYAVNGKDHSVVVCFEKFFSVTPDC